jgi:predicted type IV restriction endonuclease
MITKVKGKYIIKSKSGKRLSKPMSRKQAVRRLKQIEYFKRKK